MRASTVALVALVFVGTLLRLWDLGAHRLGFDEAFTMMAGRKSLGTLFDYLRVRDSHPPLDYVLRAPLARAGASESIVRLPSVISSVGALALFAAWMRKRGLAGIVATALLAVSTFQLVHGREARMYAELELIGVAVAMLADAWLRRPRAWHAPAIGALAIIGLLTHVSMFLLIAGLVVLAGRRTDHEAWRWRSALAVAVLAWAVLWGPSFLVQSVGGHSSWIPRTTVDGIIRAFGGLITPQRTLQVAAIVLVAAGAARLWRADQRLARVFGCCVLVPTALVALIGLVAPVLLDRTMTLWSWGPWLALAYLAAGLTNWSRIFGALAISVAAVVMIPSAVTTVTAPSNVDLAVRHLERVARPGDVVARRPGGRLHLLLWSVGVRKHEPTRVVRLVGLGDARGVVLGQGSPTGRTWLLESAGPVRKAGKPRCAPDRSFGALHVVCWRDALAGTRGGRGASRSPGARTSRSRTPRR